MRPSQKKRTDSTDPLFRNTRSKLYNKKKSSFENQQKADSKDYSHQNSGNYWKVMGNESFKKGQYEAAIQSYTKAIQINPGQSQYYSNRSKCYQKLWKLDNSLKDAEVACELEEENIKAHYICGCILAEMGKKEEVKLNKAENRLRKALRLCRTKAARQYEQQVSIKLFRLKKLIWFKQKQKQLFDIELEHKLIKKSYEQHEMSEDRYNGISQRLKNRQDILMQPQQIPDHLICKITLMLMEDPVVSEQGFTYERKVLEEHYKIKGPIEPITRKEVSGRIYSNHALKQAIDIFLKQNPWAFQEEKGQDYFQIKFF